MNAPTRALPLVAVDALALFESQCARWATAYAEGRATLQRVADLLEALAPPELDVDQAQRVIADAIEQAEYGELAPPVAEREKSPAPVRTTFRVAASTMMAAKFLIQQNDIARLKAWLTEHDTGTVAAIWEHINSTKTRGPS